MSLELLIGPMFAGKSSAIQSIVRRHQALGWSVFVITHSMDTRYSESPMIVNHDKQAIPAVANDTLMPFLTHPEYLTSKLVVVEEAQFFPDLVPFILRVVDDERKHCVVVGLVQGCLVREVTPTVACVNEVVVNCVAATPGPRAVVSLGVHSAIRRGGPRIGRVPAHPRCRSAERRGRVGIEVLIEDREVGRGGKLGEEEEGHDPNIANPASNRTADGTFSLPATC